MKYPDVFEQLTTEPSAASGYGEPYQTPDGATVIPLTKPAGVFVIRVGEARWVPAVDKNRVALIGALTGLLTGVIATLAVLRQPPWPLITITENK